MGYATGTIAIAVIILLIAAAAVVGGIAAIFREKVIVDKDTRQIVQIEIPGFKGKFKTNYPSVIAIGFGCAVIFGVINWLDVKVATMPVTATVTVKTPNPDRHARADVYLSVVPQRYKRSQSGVLANKPEKLTLDVDQGQPYDIIVYTPLFTRPDGTTQREVEFGPMKIKDVDGRETGVFSADLNVGEKQK